MKLQIKWLIFFCFFLCVCNVCIIAQGYISIDSGLTFIGNADANSAVSPIVPHYGFTIPIFFSSYFYLKTGIYVTGTNYMDNGVRPVPAEIENREYWVVIPEIDCLAGIRLPITTKMELGANLGLAFITRFVIPPQDTALNWFYSDIKFLYPACEFLLRLNIEKDYGLVFSAKGLYPVYHLWSNDNTAFWDQMIISANVGFFFALPAR